MELKELMKVLVETEDKMARMKLVEENKEILEPSEPKEPSEPQEPSEDWKTKYMELEKKYIDTFFGGGNPEKKEKVIEEEKEEEKEEKKKTLKDLGM